MKHPARSERKMSGWIRGGALVCLVAMLGVGMLVGDRFRSEPERMTDGTAWVPRGSDLVRGSAYTRAADWSARGAVKEHVRADGLGQDGSDVVVVAGKRAFSIDPKTLKPSRSLTVDPDSQAIVRGGRAYIVGDGTVTCLEPGTGVAIAKPVDIGSRGRGVVDAKGVLWVAVRRSGRVYKIRSSSSSCRIDRKVDGNFPAGNHVDLTLAGGRVVLADRDAGTVAWLDQRTGEVAQSADVPKGATVQGPSMQGDRVWLSGPGRRLTGVDPKGRVVRVDVSVPRPRGRRRRRGQAVPR